jgi:hypothetical protein
MSALLEKLTRGAVQVFSRKELEDKAGVESSASGEIWRGPHIA